MNRATLRSNRGDESLDIELLARRDCGPDPGADAAVVLVDSSWTVEGVQPVRVDLGRVHVSMFAVDDLVTSLEEWLALPLSELAKTPLACEHDLAFALPCKLSLRFGTRADTVSTRNPVLTIAFVVGPLSGEIHFVTDQSCSSADRHEFW